MDERRMANVIFRTAMVGAAALVVTGCATTDEHYRTDFYDKGFAVRVVSRISTDFMSGLTEHTLLAVSSDSRNLCVVLDRTTKRFLPAGGEVKLSGGQPRAGGVEVFEDLSRCR